MDHIRLRLSCILLLLDDYTGMPVKKGQAAARTLCGQQGFHKELGYVVFMDTGEEEQQILIESPYYQRREISIAHWDSRKEPEPFLVRLLPSRGYRIPRGASVLTGRAKPGSRVLAFVQPQKQPVRLLEDYKKGEQTISLFHKTEELGRTCMAVWESDPKEAEYFWLGEMKCREKKEFYLESCPVRKYQRAEATVCQVSSAVTEADGIYFLLLKNVPESGGLCLVKTEEEKELKSCEISCGAWNCFDLTGP